MLNNLIIWFEMNLYIEIWSIYVYNWFDTCLFGIEIKSRQGKYLAFALKLRGVSVEYYYTIRIVIEIPCYMSLFCCLLAVIVSS